MTSEVGDMNSLLSKGCEFADAALSMVKLLSSLFQLFSKKIKIMYKGAVITFLESPPHCIDFCLGFWFFRDTKYIECDLEFPLFDHWSNRSNTLLFQKLF